MLKYNKLVTALIIIINFWGKFCYATENVDKFDNAERGFGNSNQVLHQVPLQPELSNQDNRLLVPLTDGHEEAEGENVEVNHSYVADAWITSHQLMDISTCVCRGINQHTRYYCLLPRVQEYGCQVAASVTSGIILYGIFKVLQH